MSSDIINAIKIIKNLTYLELGVDDNCNFEKILCDEKMSVDINGKGLFTGTTDEYFNKHKEKFDIIYIDANHDLDFVVRDFNNSVDRANHWVLIHDMIPPSKKYTKSFKCSNSYLLLYHLVTKTNNTVYAMNDDFGLTFIKMPAVKVDIAQVETVPYNEFMNYIQKIKLYSRAEIIQMLRKNNV